MYEKDGIVYAGDPKPVITVREVTPLDDYKMEVVFNDNVKKICDMSQYLDLPCYQPLKDKELFKSVSVAYGCTVWHDGEIDIAPETLYYN